MRRRKQERILTLQNDDGRSHHRPPDNNGTSNVLFGVLDPSPPRPPLVVNDQLPLPSPTTILPSQQSQQKRRRVLRLLLIVCIFLLHILAITWTVVGTILAFQKLHTHDEECDMTWSHRVFFEVPLFVNTDPSFSANSDATADAMTSFPYKFYKFMDARDPRYAATAEAAAAAVPSSPMKISVPTANWWCPSFSNPKNSNNSNTSSTAMPVAVLYIPGHGGNYQQARSLGAHLVLGLTRKQQGPYSSLKQQARTMDVYAVDFAEEGTALHPAYLERQLEFVHQVVRFMEATCSDADVAATTSANVTRTTTATIPTRPLSWILVGHSMGGWVATAAAATNTNDVRAIVNLATPHRRPVLSWSVWQWHRNHVLSTMTGHTNAVVASVTRTNNAVNDINKVPILAIAGGLRDEMVPPEVVELPPNTSVLRGSTILATDMMHLPMDHRHQKKQQQGQIPPTLGMDHAAIVWCHNLLAPLQTRLVRLVMNVDRNSDSSNDEQALWYNGNRTYAQSVQQQRQALRTMFGTWQSMAMETGALYNVEWLVWLYALVGAFHVVFFDNTSRIFSMIMIPVAATLLSVLAGLHHILCPPQLHVTSILALALSANGIFGVLRVGVHVLLPSHHVDFLCGGYVFLSLIVLAGRTLNNPRLFPGAALGSIFLASTIWVVTARRHHNNATKTNATVNCQGVMSCVLAWVIPLQLLLVAGDFMVLSWCNGFGVWLTAACKLCLPPLLIRMQFSSASSASSPKDRISDYPAVHYYGWRCQQVAATGCLVFFGVGQFPFLLEELHPVGGLVLAILMLPAAACIF